MSEEMLHNLRSFLQFAQLILSIFVLIVGIRLLKISHKIKERLHD